MEILKISDAGIKFGCINIKSGNKVNYEKSGSLIEKCRTIDNEWVTMEDRKQIYIEIFRRFVSLVH